MDQTKIKLQTPMIEEKSNQKKTSTSLDVNFDEETLKSWDTWTKSLCMYLVKLSESSKVVSKNVNLRNELKKYIPSKHIDHILIWWNDISKNSHKCEGNSFYCPPRDIIPFEIKFQVNC